MPYSTIAVVLLLAGFCPNPSAAQNPGEEQLARLEALLEARDPAGASAVIEILLPALDAEPLGEAEERIISAGLHVLVQLEGSEDDGAFLLDRRRLSRANRFDLVKVAAYAAQQPKRRMPLLVQLLRICPHPELEEGRSVRSGGPSHYLFDFLLAHIWTHGREDFIVIGLEAPLVLVMDVFDGPRLSDGSGFGALRGAFGGGRSNRPPFGSERVRTADDRELFQRYTIELAVVSEELEEVETWSGIKPKMAALDPASYRVAMIPHGSYLLPEKGKNRLGFFLTTGFWERDLRPALSHALAAYEITAGSESLKDLATLRRRVTLNDPHPLTELPTEEAQAQRNLWRSLRDAVVKKGLLSRARAEALKPKHETRLDDFRSQRETPLPPLRPVL